MYKKEIIKKQLTLGFKRVLTPIGVTFLKIKVTPN
jgi:putative transposon-encoded protein